MFAYHNQMLLAMVYVFERKRDSTNGTVNCSMIYEATLTQENRCQLVNHKFNFSHSTFKHGNQRTHHAKWTHS